MGGGAWPFLVGGVICQVNSVNERDLSVLVVRAVLLYGTRIETDDRCLADGSLRQ